MTTLETPADRYRRRRRWPMLVAVVVLLVGAGIIWFQILKPTPALATGCNEPGVATTSSSISRTQTAPSTTGSADATVAEVSVTPTTSSSPAVAVTTSLGTYVDRSTLTNSRPSNPQTIALQVFNASETRGLARTVTNDLRTAGFASVATAADDLLYPARDLGCYGQIRFGAAGVTQARTVLMVAPCAQLVMDTRIDASVDLALGSLYRFDGVSPEVKAQLQAIIDASAPPPVIEGQTAAARPLGAVPPLPEVDCSNGAPPKSVTSVSSTPRSTESVPSTDVSSSAETSVSDPQSTDQAPLGPDSTESGEAPQQAPNDGDNVFGG